jgi:hypothetical protein
MDNWKGRCHRCHVETDVHIMSMFNTELICLGCKEKEEQHPDYAAAREAELEQIKQGNYNYKGKGYPQ